MFPGGQLLNLPVGQVVELLFGHILVQKNALPVFINKGLEEP